MWEGDKRGISFVIEVCLCQVVGWVERMVKIWEGRSGGSGSRGSGREEIDDDLQKGYLLRNWPGLLVKAVKMAAGARLLISRRRREWRFGSWMWKERNVGDWHTSLVSVTKAEEGCYNNSGKMERRKLCSELKLPWANLRKQCYGVQAYGSQFESELLRCYLSLIKRWLNNFMTY